ncbi:hypothetical protein FQN50_003053 [Emmonsiellopsis sp. PD_5]|nr:hypothetical protein FQN50_003053 [Emmonsiellopsis sp. PD_5]
MAILYLALTSFYGEISHRTHNSDSSYLPPVDVVQCACIAHSHARFFGIISLSPGPNRAPPTPIPISSPPIKESTPPHQTAKMMFTRGFSLTNFVIGSSALCFQIFVLYPWHEQLDRDFAELRKAHIDLVKQGEKDRTAELKNIHERLAKLDRSRGFFW